MPSKKAKMLEQAIEADLHPFAARMTATPPRPDQLSPEAERVASELSTPTSAPNELSDSAFFRDARQARDKGHQQEPVSQSTEEVLDPRNLGNLEPSKEETKEPR